MIRPEADENDGNDNIMGVLKKTRKKGDNLLNSLKSSTFLKEMSVIILKRGYECFVSEED